MWSKKISLDEACDLSDSSMKSTVCGEHRWTYSVEYVVEYKESPTGYAGFILEEPRSFENMGLVDVNDKEIELYPMESKEIVVIEWFRMTE